MNKLIVISKEQLQKITTKAYGLFERSPLAATEKEQATYHFGFNDGVRTMKALLEAEERGVVTVEFLDEKLPIVQAQIALQDAGFMVKNSQNLMLIVDLYARRPSAIEVAAALPEGVNLSAVFFAGSPVYLFADETAELAFVKSMKLDCRPPRDL